ncbi:hypothetical protein SAMN02745126_03935 [Enhydrobacter aerosaccus]|uniref:Uncharacterized protein n=2 Tax=Enhydrobacter aerosaccus TaxID=225324 RepID=A0A1T4RM72_9HYPH|nr:hypothetical protein SAMN02745126_03935 [Enhydrobacter aerosaccus]
MPSPTDEEIAYMVPAPGESGYKAPYSRWKEGVQISVIVVTSHQSAPCLSKAINDIRIQVEAVRQEIPALAGLADPTVVEAVPAHVPPSTIVLALPTNDAKIGGDLTRFAEHQRDDAKLFEIDNSVTSSHGFTPKPGSPFLPVVRTLEHVSLVAIETDHIVSVYDWHMNARGIDLYSDDECQRRPWGQDLIYALGAYNFDIPMGSRGLRLYIGDEKRYPVSRHYYDRLFLRTLYSLNADIGIDEFRRAFRKALKSANPP